MRWKAVNVDKLDAALGAVLLEALAADRLPWMDLGLCQEYPDIEFFPPRAGGSSAKAYAVCEACLVRRECAAWAYTRSDVHGIWGGTSPQSRAKARMAGLDVDELLAAVDNRRAARQTAA